MTAILQRSRRPTADTVPRQSVGFLAATATLARRKVLWGIRSGDALIAALSPIVFFTCFYVPLHKRFEAVGIEYAQFMTPIILLQAGIFTALVATEAAGQDARAGMRERLLSLPIPRVSPIAGRMVWAVVRMLIALCGGLAIGYGLGFRFHGSLADTAGFITLVVVFALALSLLTDAAGSIASNSTAVASLLMIPQLVFVMASTGMVPAEGFPTWIQPFVRNQPLSVFTDALRALAEGREVDPAAVFAWSGGLIAVGVLAAIAVGRRQVGR